MSSRMSALPVFGVLLVLIAGGVAVSLLRPKPEVPVPTLGQPSREVDIDVYIDGTGSIKNLLSGLPHADAENYLHDFLGKCEGALKYPGFDHGWGKSNLFLWKFGAGKDPVSLKDGALADMSANSMKSGYFNDAETRIDIATGDRPQQRRGTNRAELKVIVTDLYQSDRTSDNLDGPLADEFLKNGDGAVAVIGIRNAYSGGVDDLPDSRGDEVKLPPGTADSMPFYVIVAGDHAADVRIATATLIQKTGLRDAINSHQGFTVYFSRNSDAVEQQSRDFSWAAPSSKSRESAVGRFSPAQDSFATRPLDFSWHRMNSGKPSETGTVSTGMLNAIPLLAWRKSTLALSWEPAATETLSDGGNTNEQDIFALGSQPKIVPEVEVADRVSVKSPGTNAEKNSASAIFAPRTARLLQRSDATALAAIRDTHYNPASHSFNVTIDRAMLQHGRIYLFRFDVLAQSPTHAFDPDQPLMKAWNIEDREPKDIGVFDKARNPGALAHLAGTRPGRTPNLSRFLSALQGQMFHVETDPVRAATYYLYVKAR